MKRMATALAVVGATLGMPVRAAHAQTPPSPTLTARQHLERGLALAREGDFAGALAEFLASYTSSRNPLLLFNIAAAHEQLNHYVDALDAINRFNELAPPAAVARRRGEIDAAVQRLRTRIGLLAVVVVQPDLHVAIDGIERNVDELRGGVRVTAGRHRVRLTARGFRPREEEVDVPGEGRAEITRPLVPVRSSITVDADVADATIRIDGQSVGVTPRASAIDVEEGAHDVVVERAGYVSWRQRVEARESGAVVHARLEWLDPMPAGVGARLVVRTNEPPVVVHVDGHRVPASGARLLPPGSHALRIDRGDFLSVEQSIVLRAAETSSIDIQLRPTPSFRRDWTRRSEDAMTARNWLLGLSIPSTAGGGAWFVWSLASVIDVATRLPMLDSQIRMCEQQLICPPSPGALVAERDSLVNSGGWYYAQVAASGVLMVTGLVGIASSLALSALIPDRERFRRSPRYRVSLGLGGGSATLAF